MRPSKKVPLEKEMHSSTCSSRSHTSLCDRSFLLLLKTIDFRAAQSLSRGSCPISIHATDPMDPCCVPVFLELAHIRAHIRPPRIQPSLHDSPAPGRKVNVAPHVLLLRVPPSYPLCPAQRRVFGQYDLRTLAPVQFRPAHHGLELGGGHVARLGDLVLVGCQDHVFPSQQNVVDFVLPPLGARVADVVDARHVNEVLMPQRGDWDAELMLELPNGCALAAQDRVLPVVPELVLAPQRVRAAGIGPSVGKCNLGRGTLLQEQSILRVEQENGESSMQRRALSIFMSCPLGNGFEGFVIESHCDNPLFFEESRLLGIEGRTRGCGASGYALRANSPFVQVYGMRNAGIRPWKPQKSMAKTW